jgi:hypothetical protein
MTRPCIEKTKAAVARGIDFVRKTGKGKGARASSVGGAAFAFRAKSVLAQTESFMSVQAIFDD